MSEHAPGEWKLEEGNDDILIWSNDEASNLGFPIARLDCLEREQDEELANARLIAAAPCLLEALVKIAELSQGFDEDGSTGPKEPLSWESVGRLAIDLSRSAIAKATGE